jgi:hypothetical protein
MVLLRILFLAEDNPGGGAISNYYLAVALTSWAEVVFFAIGYNFTKNKAITYYGSKSKKSLRLRYFISYWKTIINFDPDVVHSRDYSK